MICMKKNVILTPSEYDGESRQKGIVTFDCLQGETRGLLRCYNIDDKEDKYIFGVTINERIYKFDITKNYSIFSFSLPEEIKVSDKIGCMVVDFKGKNFSTILMGSTETTDIYCTESIKKLLEQESLSEQKLEGQLKNKSIDKTEQENEQKIETINQNPNEHFKNVSLFDLYEENETKSNLQDDVNASDNSTGSHTNLSLINDIDFKEENKINQPYSDEEVCHLENCYHNFSDEEITFKPIKNLSVSSNVFSEGDEEVDLNNYIDSLLEDDEKKEQENGQEVEEKSDEKLDENITKTFPHFYAKVKPQIDLLFADNKRDNVLEDILPESEFIKIANNSTSDYYVFGLIKEKGSVRYICYGIPAENVDDKPFNLDGYYQWLPLDVDNPEGVGYYLAYQDAETGDNIKMTII